MKKLLTIIVTYNGMQWLDQCLSSVRNSDTHSDIFIVDNGSTDGSIDFIKKNYPEAILIESKENLGFGRANNLGFKYAIENGYDYVYLLNQDAWVEEDVFSKMMEVSETNPKYGILSPLQVNKEKNKLDFNFQRDVPLALTSDSLCKQKLKDVYTTRFVMAAHWMIPVDKLKIIGGFSPAFHHYGEDDNLIDRCLSKNFNIGLLPSVIGVHDRENRVITKEKQIYINYVRILVLLNRPNVPNRLIKFLKILTHYSIPPSKFKLGYVFKSIGAYIKSAKYRRIYQDNGAFIIN